MTLKTIQHVGITLHDIDAAAEFFVGLGLEVEGRMFVEDPFLDTVCGIPDARTEIIMLRPPGGGLGIELARFVRPETTPNPSTGLANEVGIRNVCLEITDLRATVERLRGEGYELVGGIGEWQGSILMAYVRGPEGVIVSLTERID